ncbi:hypothetical protein SPI_01596 [Niveomyces insectorum RCEF 264]|uniref:Uncharacterized protein n=1 Tax=Niveomyces insectorum RCEF 264 TaxID=1081102 RepID=A0A162MU68_9HYPO|nr:hypothetical protein SPI_01596 [Niveomyces insectorum RCEF 264]
MDAMYINSKPHLLLSDDSARHGTQSEGRPPPTSRQRAASDVGFNSGSATAAAAAAESALHRRHPRPHHHLLASTSSTAPTTSTPFASNPPHPSVSFTAITSHSPRFSLPAQAPAPPHSAPGSSFLLPPRPEAHRHIAGNQNSNSNSSSNHNSKRKRNHNTNDKENASGFAAPHTAFLPLFFGPRNDTTPETSLVGARGKSIPLDDTIAAHRTSALRELNNTFPSPVFRHRHTKSAGATNTTYSQPVIVRTYSGPSASASPSTSAHYRPSGSTNRTGSRASGVRRTPLPAGGPTPSSVGNNFAANSRRKHAHAPGAGWGITESILGMARSKAKKGSLIPWSWATGTETPPPQKEAKLPPIEAFSFKGFMADLQATTDIRTDLDRIAEICARSRYSLSDQYDAHVAPHGSGANFVTSGGQPASRGKGWRKGSVGTGGPTLQAVPSDDDESSARGHRRRRGGIGGGRRRSAAYGTLETIMSSSRSSEEDKSKKKSAADIAEAVRGRAARKAASTTDNDAATADAKPTEGPSKPGSGSSPRRKSDPKRAATPPEDNISKDASEAVAVSSTSKHPRQSTRRQKPTAFAHAVIDSNRHQQGQTSAAETGTPPTASAALAFSTVPALLSEPALPQTSDGLLELHTAPGIPTPLGRSGGPTIPRSFAVNAASHSTRASGRTNPAVHVVGVDDDADEGLVPSSLPDDQAAAGFLSGLSNWIPWMVNSNGPDAGYYIDPSNHGQPAQLQRAASSGPSHAEGSLRELLKTVEASKQNKGKAVERED